MSELLIEPNMKVATLLEQYPQLEEMLIEMAPPFKKLRNPVLRRSVAKVASLRQAARVGRLSVDHIVNALRAAVGQEALHIPAASDDEPYLDDRPGWFDESRVVGSLDEETQPVDSMPIVSLLKRCNKLADDEILELCTSFLPVPGIDIMRGKKFRTWTVEDAPDQFRSYFARP